MAAKVNVRFVLILTMALGTAAVILGGLYLLQIRGDATRNLRRGDEALAAGDLKKARDNYGRAIHKEPGNMVAVHKLEETILKMVPQTADEAQALYKDRLGVLTHLTRHNPTNSEYHLNLIHELARSARLVGDASLWSLVHSAAEDMGKQLPETDPSYPLSKVYSSMATFRMFTARSLDDFIEAEIDAKAAVAAMPTSDLAWANLVTGQVWIAEKMRTAGQPLPNVNDKLRDADETLVKALAAVPEGPEVSKAALYRLNVRRRADQASVSNDEMTAASDRLVRVMIAEESPDPGLIAESIDQLWIIPVEGGSTRAMTILDDFLTKDPGELEMVLERGSRRYLVGDLAGAEQDALAVANAEPLTASFLAQLQFEMRKRAAGLISDVAYRHWESAEPADKAAKLAAVEVARARLATFVIDQANDPIMLRADGKIAFAKGDYPRATTAFERLVREPAGQNVETLLFATFCLERVGEVGLAYERLVTLMQSVPPNPQLTLQKARLELRMGRFPEATATLATLSESERQKPEAKDLARLVQSRNAGSAAESEDPVTRAIGQANNALEQRDVDAARATLVAALKAQPDNFPILIALTQLETRVGQMDEARAYLAKAKSLQPNHEMVKRLDVVLQYSDPFDALVHYCEVAIPNETDRAVQMTTQLDLMAVRQRALAEQLDMQAKVTTDPAEKAKLLEGVTKCTELANRAQKELPIWHDKARKLGADNPQLVEYEFRKALAAKDWAAAEQVVARVKANNLDQVDGNLYLAQLSLTRAIDDLGEGRTDQARAAFRETARTLEGVTDRLPFSSAAWHLLGTAYQAMGNYSQAQRAYERAYTGNPLNTLVARKYVDSLIKTGDRASALRVLRTAHNLDPNDLWFRENWLDLEATDGDKLLAFRERRRIYKENQNLEALKSDPGVRANGVALAGLLGETDPARETIMDRNGELVFSEQRWLHLTTEEKADAINKARAAWQKESDEIIAKLAVGADDDLQFAMRRARLMRARNDVPGGESVLRDYIARHKDAPTGEMYIALARYLADSNHFIQAIDILKEATKYQDPKLREATLALGNLYMQVNKYGDAAAELSKAIEDNPNVATKLQIVECYQRVGRFDDAERLLQEVTAESSPDAVTTMLAAAIAEGRALDLLSKGQTAAAEKKFAEQRDTLARAEALDPTRHLSRVLLAQSFLNEYGFTGKPSLLDDALLALERADGILADQLDTSMVRVEVLRAKGNNEGVANELNRILVRQPDHPAARRQLTQLYVDTGRFDEAIKTLREAVAYNPTLPFWWESLGDLYTAAKRDAKSAYECYLRAYELLPNAGLFSKVMDAALAMTPPDCHGVIKQMNDHPSYLTEMPRLRLIYARALNCIDKRNDGIEQARLAYAETRDRINKGEMGIEEINTWFVALRFLYAFHQLPELEAFVMDVSGNKPDAQEFRLLARAWFESGADGRNHAHELQAKAIAACPPQDKSFLAELYREQGDFQLFDQHFDQAAVAYKKSLEFNPDFVDVLNNLAFMMAENMGTAGEAVQYAERAAQLKPRDASIIDTYGWVLYKANNKEKGEEYVRKSLALNDNSYEAHYHMGVILKDRGDNSGARLHLLRALELHPDPDTEQKIKRLMDDIGNK